MSCRVETKNYRSCLREQRTSGRKCHYLAAPLEACRKKLRKSSKGLAFKFDGTRVVPSAKCRKLSDALQHCLQWKSQQGECSQINSELKRCMAKHPGVVVKPTAGDKLWDNG